MNYDFGELQYAQACLKSANSKLRNARSILDDIEIPDGDEISASINSIKSKVGDAINTTLQIINQIGSVIKRFEDAERRNQNIVGEGDETSAIGGLPGNGRSTPSDARARQRLLDIVTSFDEISDMFKQECPKPGTVDHVTVNGVPMNIYKPYNYSENNKYDVLVLLHGLGGDSNSWFDKDTKGVKGKQLIDNMIYNEKCDPLIIATISYSCGSSNVSRILQDKCLPYIAANYSTYADCKESDDKLTQQQSIKNARNHFGVAGYSWGSLETEALIQNSSDYFSWFGCLSGTNPSINVPKDQDINYIYMAYGNADDGKTRHNIGPAYDSIKDNPNVLRSSIDEMDGAHNFDTWHPALYNMLQLFYNNSDKNDKSIQKNKPSQLEK